LPEKEGSRLFLAQARSAVLSRLDLLIGAKNGYVLGAKLNFLARSGQAGETGMLDENLRRWDTIDGPNCNVLVWDWIY